MRDKRKKIIVHIHPDSFREDQFADEMLDQPLIKKGDFLRKCFLSGLALHLADHRLPNMISCLLDENFNLEQLHNVLALISKSDNPTKKEDIPEEKKVLDEIKNNLLLG
ncbi:plasmid partitioning/stability family protein (plasmid) [Candidatus Arsenophonus nilaparvatae]|uniref:plasmid partitioning/stability family protein n=1 Tax=Candidatus Arsenophonus nilaparvatae TaxID=1247023 RepID=UPI000509ED77|nr:plasmid partitioning/stability family protein [Candidatus Arsenophonus nilaparvatae]